ncbi:MAG TPA: hypothetical protein VKV22_01385 [Rhodanobacteraceae bacterium]|nr:hypothetical protein [Rhodanobacteraceae bacterium]
MKVRAFTRYAGAAVAMVAASMFIVPMASAHVHIGVGIFVPGVTVGVGNCWRCGYWAAPPVYYTPAYPAPVYYPAPGYYAPPPVYYGYSYGYYAPYYPHYYHRDRYYGHGYYHGRGYYHGGYYHHDRH